MILNPYNSFFFQWLSYAKSSSETSRRKALFVRSAVDMDLQYMGEEQHYILLQQKASKHSAVGVLLTSFIALFKWFCILQCFSLWMAGRNSP